jgi:steroid delta-isomerase-like uncharacterized protein
MYTNKNAALVDELYQEDFISRRSGGDVVGSEGMWALLAGLRESWPDLRFTVDQLIAEDDLVVARWHSEGTHTGPYLEVPATGRHIKNTGISIFRIRDGKVAESWLEMDTLGILRQLDVVPAGA